MNTNIVRPLLIAVGMWGSMTACQNKQSAETAEFDSNSHQGKVKRELITIAPKVPGRIVEIKVAEGDQVQAGDTLVVLEIPEVEAKVKQAEGALMAAKAQYAMARTGATAEQRQMAAAALSASQEQFAFAEKSHKRMFNLFKDSLISAQQYDEVKMKYLGAKAHYKATKAKFQEVNGSVREEKVRMAFGTMQRAEGALLEATTARNERYVVAPADMRVESITLNKGELSLPGYGLISGYAKGNAYFRFTVREKEIEGFSVGQVYQVNLPFSKGKEVKAKLGAVKQLSSYANRTSSYPTYELGEALYELKLFPIEEQDGLFENMTVLLKK